MRAHWTAPAGLLEVSTREELHDHGGPGYDLAVVGDAGNSTPL